MPCNMVTKPTGRPRGRPRLPLREDPERYLIAYYQAQCCLLGPGASRGVALSIAMVRYGELVNDPENVKTFTTASGPVVFHYSKGTVRGDEGSSHPRDSSAFHPRADDLARKARRLGMKSKYT